MRLEQLSYIIEVDRQKCISKAAKKLFISQPSLSAAVNDLEKELSTTIFVRSTSGVKPTELGQLIIEKAQQIIGEIDELKCMCEKEKENQRNRLTVASLPAFSNYIIYEVYAAFQKVHPDTDIIILDEDYENIQHSLDSGEIDIGIIGLFEYEKASYQAFAKQNNINIQYLIEDKLCIFAGKDHPLVKKGKIYIQDINNYPVILYKNNDFSIYQEIQPSNVLRFCELETIKKIIAKGNAVALLPKIVALNDIYTLSGNIVPLEIEDIDIGLSIAMVWSNKKAPSPAKQTFIKTCSKVCANMFENDLLRTGS